MACLGVHFALSDDDVATLRAFRSEEDRLDHLQEVIEEEYMHRDATQSLYAESDKAWDAMHRSLTDGKLTWDGGSYPLNHTVLAGELLYSGRDYIMSLKSPAQVKDVAAELKKLDSDWFRAKYNAIDRESYGVPLSEEDFEYTWEWFQTVRELYKTAASVSRYVLFTADQ